MFVEHMAVSESALRAELSAAEVAVHADAIIQHADQLIAAVGDRQALQTLLKGPCGVSVLGHRHRIVQVVTRLAATQVPTGWPTGGPPCQPHLELSIPSAPTAPTALEGLAAQVAPTAPLAAPLHPPPPRPPRSPALPVPSVVASMVERVEPFKGPLPFMTVQKMRYTGPRLPIDEHYPGLHRVHEDPPVYICEGFASDAECDALVRCGDPLLVRSKTDSGVSEVRTSRSTHMRKEIPPCPELLRRVAALTGKPPSHIEVPQVARYDPGQFYRMHYDTGGEQTQMAGRGAEQGGERVCTVLLYLNTVPRGGGTRFNTLGLEVTPQKGSAVIFFPAYTDGGLDPNALHEARPAVDRKYVCQIWVHQGALPKSDEEVHGVGHRLLAALHAS